MDAGWQRNRKHQLADVELEIATLESRHRALGAMLPLVLVFAHFFLKLEYLLDREVAISPFKRYWSRLSESRQPAL